jgi:hypothetical protein
MAPSAAVAPAELFRRDAEDHRILLAPWPPTIRLTDETVRAIPEIRFRWPSCSIAPINGQAIDRVETLDRGLWTGRLVESLGPG